MKAFALIRRISRGLRNLLVWSAVLLDHVGVVAVLRITLLGSVDVWVGDERLKLGSPRQRTLFAVLALAAGTAVSVDRLVDALWGENLPGDPRALVHSYSSRL
ncbi:MAG: hypothetical protein QOF58_4729, partial [Pseudonocardiales bacterium]|nr:hypothetical protein [Pseudonocardiales bacterium]